MTAPRPIQEYLSNDLRRQLNEALDHLGESYAPVTDILSFLEEIIT